MPVALSLKHINLNFIMHDYSFYSVIIQTLIHICMKVQLQPRNIPSRNIAHLMRGQATRMVAEASAQEAKLLVFPEYGAMELTSILTNQF